MGKAFTEFNYMGQIKILKASAGSGKTFMLAYEYVRNLILEPVMYKSILAVTFTKKATGEMKSRILEELYQLTLLGGKRDFMNKLVSEENFSEETIRDRATKALSLILHDYSNFSVMTIDGFFQKIVRSFIKELHLESDYTIDFNVDYLLKLSIDNLIRKSEEDKQIREWLEAFIEDKLSNSKKTDIKKDMLPLSRKILEEQFDKAYFEKHRDKMIDFFEKLAERQKIIRDGIRAMAKAFADYCKDNNIGADDLPGKSRGVYSYIKKVCGGEIISPSATVQKLLGVDAKWAKLSYGDIQELRHILYTLVDTIDKSIKSLASIDAIIATHRTFVLLADISKELNELCSDGNKMLLSNTNYLINKLVKNNDIPYIYEKVGNNYSIIMIDEFQDTSFSQWLNFKPLIENALAQSPQDTTVVTLVGDIKQSIYRWRGGDWRILGSEVNQSFDISDILEVNLGVNYRSSSQVIDFNNRAIRSAVEVLNNVINSDVDNLYDKKLISDETLNQYNDLLLTAYIGMEQDNPVKIKDGGYVRIFRYEDNENLNQLVLSIIDLQRRGFKAKDIAILVRGKAEAATIASFLLNYKRTNEEECEGLCFDVISSEGLMLARSSAVKFIIAIYHLALKTDSVTLSVYNRYRGKGLSQELEEGEADFIRSINTMPINESFEMIVNRYSLGKDTGNIAYLQALHSLIINFCDSELADVPSFIEWWSVEGGKKSITLPEGQNAITIETIHKSKGLQYAAVLIPYPEWGLKPYANNNFFWGISENEDFLLPDSDNQSLILAYRKALEESYFNKSYLRELYLTMIESFNLLYVALTRAETELYIMLPKKIKKDTVAQLLDKFTAEVSEFGERGEYKSKSTDEDIKYFHEFPYIDIENRITIHTESDKFFRDMESSEGVTDMRGKGIILHKIFEDSINIEDFIPNIDSVCATGALTVSEGERLKEIIAKAMENPTIRNWYDKSYTVINERGILLPAVEINTVSQLRPDRVMVKGGDAVVVDYKFGKENSKHKKQIERYKIILKSMGYNNVDGYLWYINENSVVKM